MIAQIHAFWTLYSSIYIHVFIILLSLIIYFIHPFFQSVNTSKAKSSKKCYFNSRLRFSLFIDADGLHHSELCHG